MDMSTAIQRLTQLDQAGRYVFSHRDLEKVFPEDSPPTLHSGLNRLVKQDILVRAARGVYLYGLSHQKNGPKTIELIARTLRRGRYSYISLESALSEYGAISQIPVDRITIMTSGRKGEYKTPFGTIEFTHTRRSLSDILENTYDSGRPLRIATKQAAWRDLKRVGRNTHLVEEDVINEN